MFKTLLLWIGWPIAIVGVILTLSDLHMLTWELSTYARFKQGTCRIVSSEISGRGPCILHVVHQIDGCTPSNNTEDCVQEYTDRIEAERQLAKWYAVGSERPCFYDPTSDYSVLVARGIDPWRTIRVFATCLSIALTGIGCIYLAKSKMPDACREMQFELHSCGNDTADQETKLPGCVPHVREK